MRSISVGTFASGALIACLSLAAAAQAQNKETLGSRSIANAPGAKALARMGSVPAASERSTTVNVKDILPANMISGNLFKVRPTAQADGFMYYFTVDTKFGEMPAYGIEELRQRLSELPAVAKLAAKSTGEKFAKGAKESVVGTAKSAWNFINNPVSTTEALPGAVENTFSSAASSVGVQTDEELKKPARASDSNALLDKKAKAFADEFSGDLIGYSEAKRKIASEVKVDPYSTNPLVQTQLIRLARAEVGGSLATMVIPSPTVLDIMVTTNDMVWKVDEKSIIASSFKTLIRLGVDDSTVKQFLKNTYYSRSESAAITKRLANFGSSKGMQGAVALIGNVKSRAGAMLTVGGIQMLDTYRAKTGAKLALNGDYGILSAQTQNSELLLPAATDYLLWTDALSRFAGTTENAIDKRGAHLMPVLYIKGDISAEAQKNLGAIGWQVVKA